MSLGVLYDYFDNSPLWCFYDCKGWSGVLRIIWTLDFSNAKENGRRMRIKNKCVRREEWIGGRNNDLSLWFDLYILKEILQSFPPERVAVRRRFRITSYLLPTRRRFRTTSRSSSGCPFHTCRRFWTTSGKMLAAYIYIHTVAFVLVTIVGSPSTTLRDCRRFRTTSSSEFTF